MKKKPCVLIILDGLGIKDGDGGNAVLLADTPTLDSLWTRCPHALLKASGNEVGLPRGNPGNSEVGHLNIGAGQIVYQSLSRINDSIRTGKFANIPSLVNAMEEVGKRGTNLHLVGILSAGGVHGHIEHLFELMKICAQRKIDPFIHVFLDGRDTNSKDGYVYLSMLNAKIRDLGVGRIASMSGRWYAMDRNNRWERTEATYMAMLGKGEREAKSSMEILQQAYREGEDDYLFKPTTIVDDDGIPVGPVQDRDVVIFYNYREDRARQITKAFVLDKWDGFKRKKLVKDLHFLTMTGYEENLPVEVLFKSHHIRSTVSSVLSSAGMTQLHIAETEKSAHVTYFFNGGREDPNEGEEFFSIPSPKVKLYSETPKMSAEIVRDEVVYRLGLGSYDFVLVNFANPDMLGHTGVLDATVQAVEFVDQCVRDIVQKVIEMRGQFLVTADHGNCDVMIDELTGAVDTAHTLYPVPIVVGRGMKVFPPAEKSVKIGTGTGAVERGILADVGVTILSMLGLQPTSDMTGMDLLPFLTRDSDL
ncbi:2,3-bisphosphoglycerate-independent phosphoglycerate mutase [Candidatus Dojkabacteria bacterium]|nr:2,3-bisphosphoglycerate-independent phosphoglycerate mutase [Candidatus Dojkabacteria bacterium]